jgi:hypothetical protein
VSGRGIEETQLATLGALAAETGRRTVAGLLDA